MTANSLDNKSVHKFTKSEWREPLNYEANTFLVLDSQEDVWIHLHKKVYLKMYQTSKKCGVWLENKPCSLFSVESICLNSPRIWHTTNAHTHIIFCHESDGWPLSCSPPIKTRDLSDQISPGCSIWTSRLSCESLAGIKCLCWVKVWGLVSRGDLSDF